MSKFPVVAAAAVAVSFAVGYVAGARHTWRSGRSEKIVVATVNGENIYYDELEGALKLTAFPSLQKVAEQRIVAQEAKRLGISVLDSELPALDPAVVDINSRKALAQEVRTQVLLQKLLLRDVSEEKKLEAFSLFKDELSYYDISVVVLADAEQARLVKQVFDSGESFDSISARYSKKGDAKVKAGRLGFLTRPGIEKVFGADVADVAAGLGVGGVRGPIPSSVGPVYVKVHGVRSSYQELRPAVEAIIAKSLEYQVSTALLKRSKVIYTGVSVPVSVAEPGSEKPKE